MSQVNIEIFFSTKLIVVYSTFKGSKVQSKLEQSVKYTVNRSRGVLTVCRITTVKVGEVLSIPHF